MSFILIYYLKISSEFIIWIMVEYSYFYQIAETDFAIFKLNFETNMPIHNLLILCL